ncbi:hypothetical protein C8Q80DRAFT_1271432 [Daedaleopsis nitida]|nr:hypothetical protein C8Q80DRAFT_1271432 [Daedaleopsis nitida]
MRPTDGSKWLFSAQNILFTSFLVHPQVSCSTIIIIIVVVVVVVVIIIIIIIIVIVIIVMQFKTVFLLVAALIAGAIANPVPADSVAKRVPLEGRQQPCC